MMKNRTYRNMMIVINRIQKKGWSFEEAVETARRIFDQFEAHPLGLSIEALTNQVISREEWETENLTPVIH